MKTCTKCNTSKTLDSFGKCKQAKDGLSTWCKCCFKSYNKLNKQAITEKNHNWYIENKNNLLQKSKQYYTLNADKYKAYQVKYRHLNKDIINEKYKKRYKDDLEFRISKNLRSRLSNALKRNYKTGSAIKDLCCSIDELKVHLESKFTEGMTWDNYGQWHIDHVRPLASFNLSKVEQIKEVCKYTNLQPLWAEDNIRKSDRE